MKRMGRSGAFDVERVTGFSCNPHEIGSVGSGIALAKIGFNSIRNMCPRLSLDRVGAWADLSTNMAPLNGRGLSPSQIMLGRSSPIES